MRLIVTVLFLVIASITDLKFNKVKNSHILVFMFVGLIMNSFAFGFEGLTIASIGIIIPLIIGYPLFLSGLIPAGDVKMFMALGAINGIHNTGRLVMVTLLLGGIYSIFLLIRRKDFSGFFSFYHYLKEMVITRNLSSYNAEKSIRFPLAPVTFISYLAFIFLFDML